MKSFVWIIVALKKIKKNYFQTDWIILLIIYREFGWNWNSRDFFLNQEDEKLDFVIAMCRSLVEYLKGSENGHQIGTQVTSRPLVGLKMMISLEAKQSKHFETI